MEPKTAAPLQGSSSPFKELIPLGPSPITGTITIGTDGSLTGSSSTSGWQVQGNVITFGPQQSDYYSLSLQKPDEWTWNISSTLQIFQGGDNVCGFFSNNPSIAAFNSSANQTPQLLTMILNLEDANHQAVPVTVFLSFPAGQLSVQPPTGPFSLQPINDPVEGEILGTVHTVPGNPDQISHIDWETVSVACTTSNNTGEGGEIKLKPISGLGLEVKAWHVWLAASGEGWSLGPSPAFEVCIASNLNCGVVFPGPGLKVYNHLHHEDSGQTLILALKMTKGTLTQWLQDPTVVFEPPDPPATLTLQS